MRAVKTMSEKSIYKEKIIYNDHTAAKYEVYYSFYIELISFFYKGIWSYKN